MLTLPARMSCAKRLPSVAAISGRSDVICQFCGTKGSETAMLPTYPQANVTAWCCSGCQSKLHDQASVRQAKRIETLRAAFLARKGYAPTSGSQIFASHAALKKVVAFVNGRFDRAVMKSILSEARSLELPATRLAVLVNGIVVYSGGEMQLIRVDQFFSSEDTANAMLADLMADVRAGKQ